MSVHFLIMVLVTLKFSCLVGSEKIISPTLNAPKNTTASPSKAAAYPYPYPYYATPTKPMQAMAASAVPVNSTSPQPKVTSYFNRDPQGPGTYEFGFKVEDEATGNIQFREERRYTNGTIAGLYGYLRSDGKMAITKYVADEKGYRAKTNVTKHSSSSPSPSSPSTPTSTTTTTIKPSTATAVPGLNLNSGTLPPQLVEGVMKEYQIDLSPDADPSDILHPNISDIINGKVPLKSNGNNSELGFEVVHNFIPNDFPIVPFQLPTDSPY